MGRRVKCKECVQYENGLCPEYGMEHRAAGKKRECNYFSPKAVAKSRIPTWYLPWDWKERTKLAKKREAIAMRERIKAKEDLERSEADRALREAEEIKLWKKLNVFQKAWRIVWQKLRSLFVRH